ncbi:MAG: hypothetical protein ACK5P5_14405 [Pseudobdellovibrionaceae bacterium]
MLRITMTLILVLCAGCNKKEPNPELKDRIYLDMKSELSNAEAQVIEYEKKVAEMAKEMAAAKPQTGEFKKYQKYFFRDQNSLSKYKQQITYWKIRIAQRKTAVQSEYSKAFESNQEWPNQKEYQEYFYRKKLRLAKIEWDIKQRIANSKDSSENGDSGTGGATEDSH